MLAEKIQQDITAATDLAKPKRKASASKKGKAAEEIGTSKELYNYLYEESVILHGPILQDASDFGIRCKDSVSFAVFLFYGMCSISFQIQDIIDISSLYKL